MKRVIIVLMIAVLAVAGFAVVNAQCNTPDPAGCDGTNGDDNVVITGEVDNGVDLGFGNDTVDMSGGGSIGSPENPVPGNGINRGPAAPEPSDPQTGGPDELTVIGGSINADGNGIADLTNGDINNSADIQGGNDGITTFGAGDINNSGTVTGGDNGIQGIGSGVNNSGTVEGGNSGISANSGGDITNTGTVEGGRAGVINIDGGDITNSGTITGGETGIESVFSGSDINNSGTITGGETGIESVFSDSDITNSGTIEGGETGIEIVDGTTADVNDTINNSGTITGGQTAIDADGGDNTINNSGTLNGDVITGDGADTINNDGGAVNGDVNAGAGDNTVTNTGEINGSVNAGDGNDTVNNDGTLNGNVNLGGGDDIFNGENGSTNGTVDGGDGTDTINLSGEICDPVDAAGGSVGGTSWTNFEFIGGQLVQVSCESSSADPRLNSGPGQAAAPVALFCDTSSPDRALVVYRVSPDGSANKVMHVLVSELEAGSEQAASMNTSLILDEAEGATLRAEADGTYSIAAPSLTNPGEFYSYSLGDGTCG